MSRNSRVILAKNIKLDKNYKSVLRITESDMVNLMMNQNNLVLNRTGFSFLRDGRNGIQIKESYSSCVQANYIAFQNPSYSNKWFFAFIDEVNYISDAVTEIIYTIDIFTTWWEYWSPKACFVVREHVVDDTIGLHTVPENVETGDYFPSAYTIMNYGTLYAQPYYLCVGVSDNLLDTTDYTHQYNRVYSGIQYIVIRDQQSLNNLIKKYDNADKKDAIYCMFMIPGGFLDSGAITWSVEDDIYYYTISHSEDETHIQDKTVSRPSQVGITSNKYTPKNNKLLTEQFIYILINNMSGSVAKYAYEYFTDPTACKINIDGAITPGCSLLIYPEHYKNNTGITEGIMASKLPICSWNSDVYTNWLTENGVNIALSSISSGLQVVGGIGLLATGAGAMAGSGMLANAGLSIASTMGQVYQHSLAPRQAEGNTNTGDIMFAMNRHYPTILQMSIKEEYAVSIDNYLTRMGYKVNVVKVPNMSHRQNYNYVQVASEDNVAYPNNHNNIGIPAGALNDINNMFRVGITIWNNHTNFGDYSVSNNITA